SATMTGIIDTLEKEGLIERVKSPEDRRRVNIRITDTGRAFMDDFLPKHHAYMKAFSSKLSERERQTLRRLIGKLHQSIAEGVGQDIQPPPRSTS
ncbi:MAG: MarR family transcriptional regulator, partial [bacterium]|nr:MarR family transcriptional regulator [bacterium]